MYITPRTLLGIIRISQSLAKLHFRSEVQQQDVDQALKLMDYSIRSLRSIKDEKTQRRNNKSDTHKDLMSRIINDIRQIMSHSDR